MSTSSLYTNILRGAPMNEMTEEEQHVLTQMTPVPQDLFTIDENAPKFAFFDSSKLPMDIVCNGFSMKDVIFNVLESWEPGLPTNQPMAEEITDALALHLRLKQEAECDHGSCEEGDMRKCFKCGELFR